MERMTKNVDISTKILVIAAQTVRLRDHPHTGYEGLVIGHHKVRQWMDGWMADKAFYNVTAGLRPCSSQLFGQVFIIELEAVITA